MSSQKKIVINWFLFIITIVIVFLIGLLASSIIERKTEARFAYTHIEDIPKQDPRNELWAKNYPKEFESYYMTQDTSFLSKYNGNAKIDMLEVDPRLVVLWAGYSFSKEYNQGRGHFYAIDDIRNILRTGAPTGEGTGPMPATCWTCKSPDVPRLMEEIGVTNFYKGKWADKGPEIHNGIGCADCHDSETMQLIITRPALVEAFDRQGRDISKATHNEMRSLVCAQCHVEYYFNKELPGKEGVPYLVFPWDNGQSVEDMEEYYDEIEFSDWTHQMSKAPMLKAQHPGYETFLTGVHAERGVSCADCHMPYKTEGGVKFTDHHIQSPLNNITTSCAVCHRTDTEKLIKSVYDRQDKIIENRDKLEELLVRAHVEAKRAWDIGATESQMSDILQDIRHAQWRWDYAAAAHGASFHSPVEIGRVIGTGIDVAQEARIKLARVLAALGSNEPVEYPDISTKQRAQEYIGLDIGSLTKEKSIFINTLLKEWDQEAISREAGWSTK